jgi:hypothetical protein
LLFIGVILTSTVLHVPELILLSLFQMGKYRSNVHRTISLQLLDNDITEFPIPLSI